MPMPYRERYPKRSTEEELPPRKRRRKKNKQKKDFDVTPLFGVKTHQPRELNFDENEEDEVEFVEEVVRHGNTGSRKKDPGSRSGGKILGQRRVADVDQESQELTGESLENFIDKYNLKTFSEGIYYRKYSSEGILVSLVPGCQFFFSGRCQIKVLKGTIDVCGCELNRNKSYHEVFSPKGYSLQYIRGTGLTDPPIASLLAVNMSSEVPKLELSSFPGAVFIMEGLNNDWLEGFRKIHPQGSSIVGARMTGIDVDELPTQKLFKQKFGFYFQKDKPGGKRVLEISKEWKHFVEDRIVPTPEDERIQLRFAVFGGKGVGKSTLARWTVNSLLNHHPRVLFIDLDPGQSEFTPPGQISITDCESSLLGPGFTHLKEPILSIFLGLVNVAAAPRAYISAVARLRDYVLARPSLMALPLIINTMGYTEGIGLEIAMEVIRLFPLNVVVQITSGNPRRNFQMDLEQETIIERQSIFQNEYPEIKPYEFIKVQSSCENDTTADSSWGDNAPALRNNLIAGYFAHCFGQTDDVEDETDLLSIVPFNCSLSSVNIGCTTPQNLTGDETLRVLAGNLVALCSASKDRDDFSDFTTCLGYGYLRATDPKASIAHIITPVNPEILEEQLNEILAAGKIAPPLGYFLSSATDPEPVLASGSELPTEDCEVTNYVMSGRQAVTKLNRTTRRNFKPKICKHTAKD